MVKIGQSLEDLLPGQNRPSDDVKNQLAEKIDQITLKEKEAETRANAQTQGLAYVDLSGFPIGPEALATIDREESKTNRVICFFNDGREIRLGAVSYNEKVKDLAAKTEAEFFAHVVIYLISEHSFNQAWKLYESLPKIRKFLSGLEITPEALENFEKEITTFRDLNEKIQKVSLTETVTMIVAAAIKSRSSDIHIEAEEKEIKVRYRIDGVLNDAAVLNKDAWAKVVSRIKQLAKLKINVADRPQDGRFSIYLKKERIDVRVSTLPTAFGESIVMRLLMSSAADLSFDDLGLRGQAFQVLEKEIKRPNGLIITTGPTGSGKTTTLYAIIKKLNNADTKIITIEDPIEYELKGINQSQVGKDYTFAKGLRSIVRQDPDIIMVGEIRDEETAEIAIQSALTGHLVLSTIHTNDAFGTIPRLFSLGVKPFLIGPALNVAIGQRLVRRICEKCKEKIELDPATAERVEKILKQIPKSSGYLPEAVKRDFYRGRGCEVCQGLGYRGRIGIFEILPVDDAMEKIINGRQDISEVEIKEWAQKNGVITMVQDGLLKAIDGITTVEEVFRVTEE